MRRVKRKSSIRIYVSLAIILGLSFGFYLYRSYQKQLLENRKKAWLGLVDELRGRIAGFDGQASVMIKDLKMGWEVSFEKDRLHAAASLIKIPIMAACFKAAQNQRLRLGDAIELKGLHKVNGSGLLKEVPCGTYFSVQKLIELMITESDNTATNILIGLLGFDHINEFLKDTGLRHSNLSRKMMDFKSRARGIENYTTASDMALILEKIYRGMLVNKDVSAKCLLVLKSQTINDRIPGKLPDEIVVAHKTGLENNACHDAGIVFTPKGDYLICVLTRPFKSNKSAKKFISNVSLDVYNYYHNF